MSTRVTTHTALSARKSAAHDVSRRIKNVQGQLDGVLRMIEKGDTCVEVLTQLKAARAGFDRAFALFLEENLKKCVGAQALTPEKQTEIETILAALAK